MQCYQGPCPSQGRQSLLEQEVLGAMVIPGAWQHSVLITVDLISDAGVWLKGRSESIFPKKNYIQASHFWDCKDIIYAVIFFFFGHVVHVILVPHQEWNQCSLHWKCRVLTTRPPGKSELSFKVTL